MIRWHIAVSQAGPCHLAKMQFYNAAYKMTSSPLDLSQYHLSCAHFRLLICDWNSMSPIYSKPPQHNQHQSQRCELHEQLILWDSDIPQSQDGWNHLTLRCCVKFEGSITSKSIKLKLYKCYNSKNTGKFTLQQSSSIHIIPNPEPCAIPKHCNASLACHQASSSIRFCLPSKHLSSNCLTSW